MKTFQYQKKINKKKLEVRKRKRVERSSDDPSSSIKRGEIPVCGSQQIKSDSCWTTCVYLNIIGKSLLFCYSVILLFCFIILS
jgi:hypothetical protein